MRLLLLPILLLAPGTALAHFGHLGEMAGHSHWVAGAAIGAAVAVGVWTWARGRKDGAEAEAQDDAPEAEPEAGEA